MTIPYIIMDHMRLTFYLIPVTQALSNATGQYASGVGILNRQGTKRGTCSQRMNQPVLVLHQFWSRPFDEIFNPLILVRHLSQR